MRSETKRLLSIILGVLALGVLIFGFAIGTDFLTSEDRENEQSVEISDSHTRSTEARGVVSRTTEPSTGRITGYDVRGVVMDVDTDGNTLTLSVSDNEDETLFVSLGNNTDMIGFLDKRSESSEREGLIEKNTHTSGTAESILENIAVGQTVLVHIPVWVDTPESSQCNDECVERVEALQTRGELYIPLLEDIIYTSVVETDVVFIVGVLEIEK